MRDLRIRISIEESQQARQALGEVEQGLKSVEEAGGKVAAKVGDPSKPGSVVASLGSLRAAIASLGIGLAIERTVEWGSKISDLSAKTGLSVDALLRFERAGALAGTSVDQMANGVLMLQRRLSSDEGATKAVEALGLSTDALLRMQPDQMFIAIATAVGKIEDPAKRTTAAYDLMGRSSAELIPVMVGDIQLLTSETVGASQRQIEGLDKLDDAWSTLKLVVLSELGNVLGEIVQVWTVDVPRIWEITMFGLDHVGEGFRMFVERVVRYIQALYQDVKTWLVDRFRQFIVAPLNLAVQAIPGFFSAAAVKAVGFAQNLYQGVKTWLVDKFTDIVAGVKAKIDAVSGFFGDLYDKVVGNSYVPDLVTEIGQWFGRLKEFMVDPAGTAVDMVLDHFQRMRITGNRIVDTLLNELGSKFKGFGSFLNNFFGSDLGQFASDFMNGSGDWPNRVVEAAFGFDLLGIVESFTGGPSPERDQRVIGVDENGNPVMGTGIEQDEYDRRYGTPESNYYGDNYVPFARGGIVTRPTRALIGEAGPEAVIPLSRGTEAAGSTIVLEIDGMRMAELVVPYIPGSVKRYRLA